MRGFESRKRSLRSYNKTTVRIRRAARRSKMTRIRMKMQFKRSMNESVVKQ